MKLTKRISQFSSQEKEEMPFFLSEEDWTSINESLFLLSVPGMRESIREGIDTDLSDCDTDLD